MRLLDAINVALAGIGESRIMTETAPNPTVGLVIQALDQKRLGLLATGWYFNTLEVTLVPDVEGYIDVPYDCLELFSDAGIYQKRGNRLFDLTTYSYIFTAPVKLRIFLNVEFDQLPEQAAQYVTYMAAAEVYSNDFGADKSYQGMLGTAQFAYTMLERTHLRQRKYSTRQSPRFKRILSNLTH